MLLFGRIFDLKCMYHYASLSVVNVSKLACAVGSHGGKCGHFEPKLR